MEFERAGSPRADEVPALDIDCQVIELRQYTLHPGRRDTLIELFDSTFVESQEDLAMAVMGQFRDLDAPDRFVWLRGFADMDSRARGLAAFYGGPVWRAHREAANATMIDSDDVLLLRPAWRGAGVSMHGRHRARATACALPQGVLSARVMPLHEPASADLLRHCRETLTPRLRSGGADVLGWYVSETAPNNFARLPVREGEQVLVVFAMFASPMALDAFERSGAWAHAWQGMPSGWLAGESQHLRLQPTTRSAIHA
ncbi:MAG: NIPSNAP family protein [Hydrogenophaga sp.]|nr:NIPSNAP family protein [Hydrogenophaga sp.]NIN28761.1 NIPSNAP family protein [Hydrogenophaga sp.]NIN33220.1 NIPSNAP family protein [Hydrogenophaga sp.]NIN57895.1 NIPSNAP family protein [Hydrogenophaga sp.]NIO54190.1 NIPSNAP family protein [Hydrogenophaga sp.]